jgi:hypothetical protein
VGAGLLVSAGTAVSITAATKKANATIGNAACSALTLPAVFPLSSCRWRPCRAATLGVWCLCPRPWWLSAWSAWKRLPQQTCRQVRVAMVAALQRYITLQRCSTVQCGVYGWWCNI